MVGAPLPVSLSPRGTLWVIVRVLSPSRDQLEETELERYLQPHQVISERSHRQI